MPFGRYEKKRSNTRSKCASSMPGPSSHTVITWTWSEVDSSTPIEPLDAVIPTALSSRFSSTCVTRSGGALIHRGGASAPRSSKSRAWRTLAPATMSETAPLRSSLSVASASSRASIIEISRTEEIIRCMRSTSRWIRSSKRRRSPSDSTSSSNSPAFRIEAKGFLSSCATSVANDSTKSTWCLSLRVRVSSARLRSPISSPRFRPRISPVKRPRWSTRSRACRRSRLSGRTREAASRTLRMAATASASRKTRKISKRTSYRAARIRAVDCDATTAPATPSRPRMGSAE